MALDEQIIWNHFLFALRNKLFIKQITLFNHRSRHRCHFDFFIGGSSGGRKGKETFRPVLYPNTGVPLQILGMS